MDETLEKEILQNALISAKALRPYLEGKESGTTRHKFMSIAITQYQRHMATKGALRALQYQISRALAKDKAELKKLITSGV